MQLILVVSQRCCCDESILLVKCVIAVVCVSLLCCSINNLPSNYEWPQREAVKYFAAGSTTDPEKEMEMLKR